jgi:hypothetical protein
MKMSHEGPEGGRDFLWTKILTRAKSIFENVRLKTCIQNKL